MNVVLGVCGSVASYRAADLARDLMRAGFTVRACLTDAAERFVSPALFEALTGNPCLIDTFEEPEAGRMAHIDWARSADLILVAPATASTIGKLAHGIADDMLTTICLATEGPLVIAPAMNPHMFAHPATRSAMAILAERAATIVEPSEGDVACGEHGQGKLAANSEIVAAAREIVGRSRRLEGQTVLVTSGPTQEPIDDVRFLSNRSSGRMGAALARAAMLMGAARVVVVSGPVGVAYPLGCEVVAVRTAEEMLAEAAKMAPEADWIIGAAAVADYRPTVRVEGKVRRGSTAISLDLTPNPDVIGELAKLAKGRVVGFAAEPNSDLDAAKAKLARKGLSAIAVNNVSEPGIGFESGRNDLTLIQADGTSEASGIRSKLACALWLFESLT